MAISPIFSISEVTIFVIRLVIFFVFVALLLIIFVGFAEVTQTSEDQRKANNMAEALMTSSLTEAKAVFDLTKEIGGFTLDDLNGNNIELPRLCNTGTEFVLEELTGERRRWRWGYSSVADSTTKRYVAWTSEGSGRHHALLTVSVTDDQITQFTCAIERANLLKETQEFDLDCGAATCSVFRQDQDLCIRQGTAGRPACRWFPRISFEDFTLDTDRAQLYIVPIKEGGDSSCLRGQIPSGAFRTDEERANNDVDRIAFCLR